MSTLAASPSYVALLTQVMPRVIHTEEENEAYTEILYNLTQKGDAMTSEEEDIADMLTMLIEDFEEKNYSIPRSSPLDMVEFLMDQHTLQKEDMVPLFSTREDLEAFFNGERELRTEEIRKLSERFRASPDLFF